MMFTVTDLKQAAYCPRIPYYQYCLPGLRVIPTRKMELGAIADEAEAEREERRGLRAYGLLEGDRDFGVSLSSERLGLSGTIDLMITRREAGRVVERIPVDYKNAQLEAAGALRAQAALRRNWRIQLASYALLVEATWPDDPPVARGFIYLIPARRAYSIALGGGLKAQARALVATMRHMVDGETIPAATMWRKRCEACEYRRFCNDI